MKSAKFPKNETQRIQALREYEVLDTNPDPLLDEITQLVSAVLDTPIALISLVDENRQWFKSAKGLEAKETPREIAFCAHAILDSSVLVISDAQNDDRFSDNPLVTGEPFVRFYAGSPLETPSGERIGTLCAIDHKPRKLSEVQVKTLQHLSKQVISIFENQKQQRKLKSILLDQTEQEKKDAIVRESAELGVWQWNLQTNEVDYDQRWCEMLGYNKSELKPHLSTWETLVHPDDLEATQKKFEDYLSGKTSQYEVIFRLKHKSGHWVPILSKGKIIESSPTGAPLRFCGTHFDMSLLRDLEEEKERIQDLSRQVQEMAQIGAWVVNLQEQKALWSPITYKIHEVPVGTPIALQDGINYYIPEHRSIIQKLVETAIEKHKNWDTVLQIQTATGKRRWVRAIGQPNLKDGKVVSLSGTFQDIHDQKLQEIEEKKSLQRLIETERIARLGHWRSKAGENSAQWSPGMYEIFGISNDQEPPQTISEFSKLIHPDDQALFRSTLTRALQEKKEYSFQYRILRDGIEKIIHGQGFPQFHSDGNLEEYMGIEQDITSFHTYEKEIKKLSQRLTLALEASSVGVWEFNFSEQEFLWDNQMHTLYELPKTTQSVSRKNWEKKLHPKDKKSVLKALEKAATKKESLNLTFRICSNGKTRYLRNVAKVTLNENNQAQSLVGVAWDITEERERLKAIEAANERFEMTVQGTSVGIWDWVDVNQQKEVWSPLFYELLGYSNGEIQASLSTFVELLHPDDRDKTFQAVQNHFEGKAPFDIEYRLKTKSGQYRWFRGTGQATFNIRGKPKRMVGSIADIHESKEYREQLQMALDAANRANLVKSMFLANMSHEMRTPLNSVLGFSEVLLETKLDHKQKEILKNLRDSGQTLFDLINDVLDLSRIEAGEMNIETIKFELEATLNQIGEMFSVTCESKDLDLIVEIDPKLPKFGYGDPLRIRQILTNLVGNAVKFTQQGSVTLSVRALLLNQTRSYLCIEVHDTGIGIPPSDQEKIFESFTQADSAVTRQYGGSGLGLSIVARLCNKMEGTIYVSSEREKGSTFFVRIPMKFEEAAEKESSSFPALKGKKVCILDPKGNHKEAIKNTLASLEMIPLEKETQTVIEEISNLTQDKKRSGEVLIYVSNFPEISEDTNLGTLRKIASSIPLIVIPVNTISASHEIKDDQTLISLVRRPLKRNDLKEALVAILMKKKEPSKQKIVPQQSEFLWSQTLTQKIEILVAEDSLRNQELIRLFLENTPCKVEFAKNGQEAIEKFQKGTYKMVFMDLQMPIIDGYSATRTIRVWEKSLGRSPTPIYALSAYAMSEDRKKSKEAGCTDHLTKPIKKAELLNLIFDWKTNEK